MVMLELTQRLPPGADSGPAWQEGVAAFQARAISRPASEPAPSGRT